MSSDADVPMDDLPGRPEMRWIIVDDDEETSTSSDAENDLPDGFGEDREYLYASSDSEPSSDDDVLALPSDSSGDVELLPPDEEPAWDFQQTAGPPRPSYRMGLTQTNFAAVYYDLMEAAYGNDPILWFILDGMKTRIGDDRERGCFTAAMVSGVYAYQRRPRRMRAHEVMRWRDAPVADDQLAAWHHLLDLTERRLAGVTEGSFTPVLFELPSVYSLVQTVLAVLLQYCH